jgi:hypothetical protein
MKKLVPLSLILILSSCASTYKSLRPTSSYYGNTEESNGVIFSYKHGVLTESGNKKYAKREASKAIKIVSVKIINNSNNDLIIGQNAKFYSGNSELRLIEPITLHRQLKQGVPIYLLYLLLTPVKFYSSSSKGSVNETPIGLGLGPGISIGNMAVAGSANQNFLEELTKFDLINKKILPGQTVFGLIGVNDIGYNPVKLVVTD